MRLDYGACTHEGTRENNEDAHALDAELGLFAVADGMGGHEGGEVASRVTINAITEVVAWNHGGPAPAADVVAGALRIANDQVNLRRRGALASMGSTASVLLLRDSVAVVAHVGDTRVYRLRAGVLERLTRDHTLSAGLVAAGAPVARAQAVSHILTNAIGVAGLLDPDVASFDLATGDTFLLCSDGLTGVLDDASLPAMLRGPSGSCAVRLVEAALAAGATDNVTAVVARVAAM